MLRSNPQDEELLEVVQNAPGAFAQFAHRWGPIPRSALQPGENDEPKPITGQCNPGSLNICNAAEEPQIPTRNFGDNKDMLSESRPAAEVPLTKSGDEIKDEGLRPSTSEVRLPVEGQRSTDLRVCESFIGHQRVTPEYKAYQKLMDQIHDSPDERISDLGEDEAPILTGERLKAKDSRDYGTRRSPIPDEWSKVQSKHQPRAKEPLRTVTYQKPIYRRHNPNAAPIGKFGTSTAANPRSRETGNKSLQTKGGFGTPRRDDYWRHSDKESRTPISWWDRQPRKRNDHVSEKKPFSGPGFGNPSKSRGSDSKPAIPVGSDQRRKEDSSFNQKKKFSEGLGDPNVRRFGGLSELDGRAKLPTRNRAYPRDRAQKPERSSGLWFSAEQEEYVYNVLVESLCRLRLGC